MKKSIIAAAAALALGLAAASPAAADSIAYIKGGNVWLATPDGARQAQVTTSGGYAYVSQADDGTMIALAPGERLHKLSRSGQVLADFATYVSDGVPQSGPVNKFHGPFEPTISPDGRLVAFEWFNDNYENDPSCSPASVPPCYVYSSRQGVGITHSDRLTGPEEFGLLTGWIYPHWVSNDTLLRSYANSVLNDDSVFNKIGPGIGDGQLDHWFYDQQGGQTVKDVELSRDGKTVAGIVGQGDDRLRVYRPTVDPFNAPNWNHVPFAQGNQPVVQPCYEYSNPVGGRFESVSIAPDGRHLAYGVGDGIWVSNVPDLAAGCAQATENALKIPGGRFPDWGPADVPTAGRTPAPGPGSGRRNRGLSANASSGKLGKALRRGLIVTVRGPGSGRARVTAFAGRKRVGAGADRAAANGRATVRVAFTRKAKRSLAPRRAVRLNLRVEFKLASGQTLRRKATVGLRR
jgi:WD40-like Beta Propeller Repeat